MEHEPEVAVQGGCSSSSRWRVPIWRPLSALLEPCEPSKYQPQLSMQTSALVARLCIRQAYGGAAYATYASTASHTPPHPSASCQSPPLLTSSSACHLAQPSSGGWVDGLILINIIKESKVSGVPPISLPPDTLTSGSCALLPLFLCSCHGTAGPRPVSAPVSVPQARAAHVGRGDAASGRPLCISLVSHTGADKNINDNHD